MAELSIQAKKDNLDQVLAFVDVELEVLDCPMKVQLQIDIAVEEIFVNIANYAYADNNGEVSISTGISDTTRTLFITFTDSGMPYNPLQKPDPDVSLSAEEREVGGLGIFIVKKSMDDVVYERKNGQNLSTLYKRI